MKPSDHFVAAESNYVDILHRLLHSEVQSSTLVICSSKDEFREALQASLTSLQSTQAKNHERETEEPPTVADIFLSGGDAPTLRQLAMLKPWSVVFCPTVSHLRAYLASRALRESHDARIAKSRSFSENQTSLLAIVNLIQLHRSSSAFSVQGIQRSLALSVDAANRSQHRLLFSECDAGGAASTDDAFASVVEANTDLLPAQSIWDEEISILNVTTKSFGVGDRGWAGRTVKIRQIVARWCRFEHSPGS